MRKGLPVSTEITVYDGIASQLSHYQGWPGRIDKWATLKQFYRCSLIVDNDECCTKYRHGADGPCRRTLAGWSLYTYPYSPYSSLWRDHHSAALTPAGGRSNKLPIIGEGFGEGGRGRCVRDHARPIQALMQSEMIRVMPTPKQMPAPRKWVASNGEDWSMSFQCAGQTTRIYISHATTRSWSLVSLWENTRRTWDKNFKRIEFVVKVELIMCLIKVTEWMKNHRSGAESPAASHTMSMQLSSFQADKRSY